MVDVALGICMAAHAKQVDRAGEPYWKHPIEVSHRVGDDDTARTVALLHDVIEDTEITGDDLRTWGFPDNVVEAVELLTHESGERYEDYVGRVAENPLARKVKIADISHNTDPSRADSSCKRLMRKYAKAMEILEG